MSGRLRQRVAAAQDRLPVKQQPILLAVGSPGDIPAAIAAHRKKFGKTRDYCIIVTGVPRGPKDPVML